MPFRCRGEDGGPLAGQGAGKEGTKWGVVRSASSEGKLDELGAGETKGAESSDEEGHF